VGAFVTAGAGFLLAVLWFDLMFDVQIAGHTEQGLPEGPLGSIAAYYRRVTTAARPMNRLIAVVMLGTLAAIIVEIVQGDSPRWVGWASLALAAAPILLAGGHTVPSAVRLGARGDTVDRQGALARSILREHLFCFTSIAALLVLQLSAA
jgi:hypothetical protein